MSVLDFKEYRTFLRDHIQRLPQKGWGETNRMAEHLGVHATLVSQVMSGSRDFTVEQAHQLCAYLGLRDMEADLFILFVQKERAGNTELRAYFERKIADIKDKALNVSGRLKEHRRLGDQEKSIFYSSWIYSAVRLFTSLGEGKTLDEVAQRFALSRAAAAEILGFLKDTQLCKEANGAYSLGSQHTHLEFGSPFLSRHHTNWRLKAIQRSENLLKEEFLFTSPFSINESDFRKIRELLMQMVKSTSAIIKDSPAEAVACLNVDLFWV